MIAPWKDATIHIKQDVKKKTFTLSFTSSGSNEAMSASEAYGLFTIWLTSNMNVVRAKKGK